MRNPFICVSAFVVTAVPIVVVISHIQRTGCQPQRTTVVANPGRKPLNRDEIRWMLRRFRCVQIFLKQNEEVWQPPPPPHAARTEIKNEIKTKIHIHDAYNKENKKKRWPERASCDASISMRRCYAGLGPSCACIVAVHH